ncbi:MAG TPA: hypothetical protein VEF06_12180 [Bryobacteraceae bacterium]|nr:hypothetical protein [Bryobacteraceae bacterium]
MLRIAVRRNLVSFPAQVPAFMKQPAGVTQQRVVQLYFVRGWSVRNICDRYRLGKKLVQNLLADWRARAIAAGLIQEIDPENLERLFHEQQGHPDPQQNDGADAVPVLAQPQPASVTARLMMALEEDCVELGLELSLGQLQKIERLVRGIAEPRSAPPPQIPGLPPRGGRTAIPAERSS